jgi:hypothetical protein
MKYISFTLLTLWSLYMIIVNGNLRVSDNYFLWLLSVASIFYSAFSIIKFLKDKNIL